MTDAAVRWRVPNGHIYLRDEICKGCSFCIDFCPRQVLAQAGHFNAKGYHAPEVVDTEACVLCGFCELVCPDFAIWTEQDPPVDALAEVAGGTAAGGGSGSGAPASGAARGA